MADNDNEDSDIEDPFIVIDNGSHTCKVGFAGDDSPYYSIPSIVGKPRHRALIEKGRDSYIGDETHMKRSMLDLNYPVERGIISNFDNMEKIWAYIFEKVLCIPRIEERSILHTESPSNSQANRDKIAEVMFEKFNITSLSIATQAKLALLGSGRSTGVVLDCGGGITHAVSICNGKVIPESITRLELGGCDLTDYLFRVLAQRSAASRNERAHVSDIKCKLCYIPLDYEKEMKDSASGTLLDKSYEMSVGQHIKLGEELFKCPEILFQPSMIKENLVGIHKITHNSILKCPAVDADTHREMYENIVLSGGNSMFPGIAERLKNEITALAPVDTKVRVISRIERDNFVWIGGSIVGSMGTFQQQFVTRKQYEEKGNFSFTID